MLYTQQIFIFLIALCETECTITKQFTLEATNKRYASSLKSILSATKIECSALCVSTVGCAGYSMGPRSQVSEGECRIAGDGNLEEVSQGSRVYTRGVIAKDTVVCLA